MDIKGANKMQSLICLFTASYVVALGIEKMLLLKDSSEEEQLRLDLAFCENDCFHGSRAEVRKNVPMFSMNAILFFLFVCM